MQKKELRNLQKMNQRLKVMKLRRKKRHRRMKQMKPWKKRKTMVNLNKQRLMLVPRKLKWGNNNQRR
jgi:hypothetical protein